MSRPAEPIPPLVFVPRRPSLRHQLVEHARVPLHRDGYALALNSAFTAATGLLYWIIAAKEYSAAAVGVNSALISSMMFLAGIASLNLPNIMVRFLPGSGRRALRHVCVSYAVSGGLALAAGAVFIAGITAFSPRLRFLHSQTSLEVWFLFSALAWCLFMIQDSVLVALGRAVWVPVENAVFSVLKLAFLVLLAALAPVYGIFVSWTIAMLLSVVGVNAVIFWRLLRRGVAPIAVTSDAVGGRAFARYFVSDYACSVAWLSTTNLMPVVVTAAAGAVTNAYYALAYAVALPFYAFAQSIGTSLTLHGTRDPASLPALRRRAALQGMRVLVPSVVLLVLLAPFLLSFFGSQYAAHSATVLRLLVLGSVPSFAVTLALATARVRRRFRTALVALFTETSLALGLAVPLLHALGVDGAGVAIAGAQGVVALALVASWRGKVARFRIVEALGGA